MSSIQTYFLRPQLQKRKEKLWVWGGKNKSVARVRATISNSTTLNKRKTEPSSLPQQHYKLSFQNQHVEWNTKFTERMRHCTMEMLTGFTFTGSTVCTTYSTVCTTYSSVCTTYSAVCTTYICLRSGQWHIE